MNEPTHEFLRKETGRYLLKGGHITKLPQQRVKCGLTVKNKPSDKANEETDSIDWLSDAIDPNGGAQ